MSKHSLAFILAFSMACVGPFSAQPSFAKSKIISAGCTGDQLESAGAIQCINSNTGTQQRHVECSGGTVSCCNDTVDAGGLPAGFCIDVKRLGQSKRPKVTGNGATTIQP